MSRPQKSPNPADSKHRQPEQIRRISRAIIALAQAQHEADAQAAHRQASQHPPTTEAPAPKRRSA